MLFECDPEKNTKCTKEYCHLNGGPCRYTKYPAFLKEDGKLRFVLSMDESDYEELIGEELEE